MPSEAPPLHKTVCRMSRLSAATLTICKSSILGSRLTWVSKHSCCHMTLLTKGVKACFHATAPLRSKVTSLTVIASHNRLSQSVPRMFLPVELPFYTPPPKLTPASPFGHCVAVLLPRRQAKCMQPYKALVTQLQSSYTCYAGFLQQFAAVCQPDRADTNISAVLKELSGGKTPNRVICCGHSLGGALATLGIDALWPRLLPVLFICCPNRSFQPLSSCSVGT